jgi:hypothetical protein
MRFGQMRSPPFDWGQAYTLDKMPDLSRV